MKAVKCRVDLHNHMAETEDLMPSNSDRVVDYTSRKLGDYGVLGVTSSRDDNRWGVFVKNLRYERRNIGNAIYIPEKKLWVVNNREVKTKDGHVLITGENEGECLESGKSALTTLDEAKKRGLVSILPHPAGALGTMNFVKELRKLGIRFLKEFPRLVAGIEIFNSQSSLWLPFLVPYHANTQAKELWEFLGRYRTYTKLSEGEHHNSLHHEIGGIVFDKEDFNKYSHRKVGAVSFSDGHSAKEPGTCYTNMEMPHPDEITNGYYMNSALDEGIRESKLIDGKVPGTNIIKRFAFFNGKREPAKLKALEHCLRSAFLILTGKKVS